MSLSIRQILALVLLLFAISLTKGRKSEIILQQEMAKFKKVQTNVAKSLSSNFLAGALEIEFNLAEPILKLLEMAWDEFDPNSLNNRISAAYDGILAIQQQLTWIEFEIYCAEDLKTLDYLVKKYNDDIKNASSSDAVKWADVALSFDSNGFDKSLKDIGDLMEGTENLFTKGSIFEAVGSEAETVKDNAITCITIQQVYNYLTGLWITGHAVWAQAYRMKNASFEYNAAQIKLKAEARLVAFQAQRDKAFFKRCEYESCYQRGFSYNRTAAEHIWKNVSSAQYCNDICMAEDDCAVWMEDMETKECLSFANQIDGIRSNDLNVISGPKVCARCKPTCVSSYFCDLKLCGDESCCRNMTTIPYTPYTSAARKLSTFWMPVFPLFFSQIFQNTI